MRDEGDGGFQKTFKIPWHQLGPAHVLLSKKPQGTLFNFNNISRLNRNIMFHSLLDLNGRSRHINIAHLTNDSSK